jgi:pyrroloquinoline quinone (PQQ) biosynthesis protein C
MTEARTFEEAKTVGHSSGNSSDLRGQSLGKSKPGDIALFVSEALKPGASMHLLMSAAESLLELVRRGLSGDRDSYAQYQALLLDLHLPGEAHTEPTRRWLASQIYRIEDELAPEPAEFTLLPLSAFRERVDAEIASQTRVRHPMSLHLFQGAPSHHEIKLFLHHHWIRSYNFYSLLAELAFRFDDIADASVFYRNLYGEAGEQSADRSHPALLAKLIEYFGIPLRIDFSSLNPLEKAYLNNRIRCVRHTDTAWGLALLYAVESVSQVNHLRIYELLQRQGVPEGPSEFHRLHGTQDEIDTEELWKLISKFAGKESFQRTFMQSLAQHFSINRKYFDVLWEEMQALIHPS